MTEKQLTSEEKRIQKIAQLKAKLQKEEALLNKEKRTERNGQLIVFGVMIEEILKNENDEIRKNIYEYAQKYLQDRNLKRALAGFERLKKA